MKYKIIFARERQIMPRQINGFLEDVLQKVEKDIDEISRKTVSLQIPLSFFTNSKRKISFNY